MGRYIEAVKADVRRQMSPPGLLGQTSNRAWPLPSKSDKTYSVAMGLAVVSGKPVKAELRLR